MEAYKKVQEINKLLASQGASAVQKKPGLGGRPALFGYRPQVVFDRVNRVVGPESWSMAVNEHFLNEKQCIASVTVAMFGTERTQFGESGIVKGDEGSAYKGAVTDGVQKCLALFGIGSAAYCGELGAVFNGKVSHTVTEGNPLLDVAKVVKTREEGVAWWQKNLAEIKLLSSESRNEIVAELGAKK